MTHSISHSLKLRKTFGRQLKWQSVADWVEDLVRLVVNFWIIVGLSWFGTMNIQCAIADLTKCRLQQVYVHHGEPLNANWCAQLYLSFTCCGVGLFLQGGVMLAAAGLIYNAFVTAGLWSAVQAAGCWFMGINMMCGFCIGNSSRQGRTMFMRLQPRWDFPSCWVLDSVRLQCALQGISGHVYVIAGHVWPDGVRVGSAATHMTWWTWNWTWVKLLKNEETKQKYIKSKPLDEASRPNGLD